MKGASLSEVLAALPAAPEPYALSLAEGIGERGAEIDGIVARHATAWALDRLPAIDRQLLRLATYELLAEPGVPLAVVLDEAVELAKSYSTADSARFVNGVLAAVAAEVRAAEVAAR